MLGAGGRFKLHGMNSMPVAPAFELSPEAGAFSARRGTAVASAERVAVAEPPRSRARARLSTRLRALLEHAPPRFALAGHSLGGRIALEVIRQSPTRVTRLALLDTGVHPCRPAEPPRRYELLALADREGMTAVAREWLPPMVHPARHGDPTVMLPLAAMVERRTPASFRNQVMALLNRPDATAVLGTIHCPTLVLCGRQDAWSVWSHHEEMAARIPGSHLVVIENCGHMSTMERPQEVTAAMRNWLTSLPV